MITTTEELHKLPSSTVLVANDHGFPRVYQWLVGNLVLLDFVGGGHRHPANVFQAYGPLEVVWTPARYEPAGV